VTLTFALPLSLFRTAAACLPRLLRVDIASVSGIAVERVIRSGVTAAGASATSVQFTLLLPRGAASPSDGSGNGGSVTPTASATPSALPSTGVAPSSLPSPSRGAAPVSEAAAALFVRLQVVMGGDSTFRDGFRESIALTTEVLTQFTGGGGGGNGTGNATAPISTSLITSNVGAPTALVVEAALSTAPIGAAVVGGSVVGGLAAITLLAAVSHYLFRPRSVYRVAPDGGNAAADDHGGLDHDKNVLGPGPVGAGGTAVMITSATAAAAGTVEAVGTSV
jgi:hypothetical protein